MNTNGFTLIETLVALLLIAIVAPVALESSIVSVGLERKARAAVAMSLEIDRVSVESVCGGIATNGADRYQFSCDIDRPESLAGGHGCSEHDYREWGLVCRDTPSLKSVIYTRLPVAGSNTR